jgi:hypothetical protein
MPAADAFAGASGRGSGCFCSRSSPPGFDCPNRPARGTSRDLLRGREIRDGFDLLRILEHHADAEFLLQLQRAAHVLAAERSRAHRQLAADHVGDRALVVAVLGRPLATRLLHGVGRGGERGTQLGEQRHPRRRRLDARGLERFVARRVRHGLEHARCARRAVAELDAQARVLGQYALDHVAARELDHRALARDETLAARRQVGRRDATLQRAEPLVVEVERVDRERIGRELILGVSRGREVAVDRDDAGHHDLVRGVDDGQVGRRRVVADRQHLAVLHDEPDVAHHRRAVTREQRAAAHGEVARRRVVGPNRRSTGRWIGAGFWALARASSVTSADARARTEARAAIS